MLKSLFDIIKNNPAALALFVALMAATWLYYDVYERAPLTPRELIGAAVFWALVVIAGSAVRKLLARRKPRAANAAAAVHSGEPEKES